MLMPWFIDVRKLALLFALTSAVDYIRPAWGLASQLLAFFASTNESNTAFSAAARAVLSAIHLGGDLGVLSCSISRPRQVTTLLPPSPDGARQCPTRWSFRRAGGVDLDFVSE